jgi:hypothetical protein
MRNILLTSSNTAAMTSHASEEFSEHLESTSRGSTSTLKDCFKQNKSTV